MELKEYPEAIHLAARQVNDFEASISELRQAISFLESWADKEVAWNSTLKNDNQRKSQRAECLNQLSEYREATKSLARFQADKASALSDLEELRNSFSVAKLELRMAIAQTLAGVEARELVGL